MNRGRIRKLTKLGRCEFKIPWFLRGYTSVTCYGPVLVVGHNIIELFLPRCYKAIVVINQRLNSNSPRVFGKAEEAVAL
jgi:hypothetical protein